MRTVSDADYLSVLQKQDSTLVLLYVLTYLNIDTMLEEEILFSYGASFSCPDPTSAYPLCSFPEYVYAGGDSITTELVFFRPDENKMELNCTQTFGSIKLMNPVDKSGVGLLDYMIDLPVDGRNLKVYIGTVIDSNNKRWSFDDFRLIRTLIVEKIKVTGSEELTIDVKNYSFYLNKEIQSTLISVGDSKEEVLPISLGECSRVPLTYLGVISGKHRYKCSGKELEKYRAVQDGGDTLTESVVWTNYKTFGEVELVGSAPVYDLTANVLGEYTKTINELSTNYLLYSNTFTNSAWVKTNCNILQEYLFFNNLDNSYKLTETGTGFHNISQAVSLNSGIYTASIYVKNTKGFLTVSSSNFTFTHTLNTLTENINSGSNVLISYGTSYQSDGWYKIWITFNITTTTNVTFKTGINSLSTATTETAYFSFATLENSAVAGSFIKTTSAPAIRETKESSLNMIQIVSEIILNYSKITLNDLEINSFKDIKNKVNYAMGLYVGDRQNIEELLTQVLASGLCYKFWNREGKLTVKRFSFDEEPIIELSDFEVDTFTLEDSIIPANAVKVGYYKNNSPTDKLAKKISSGLSEAELAKIKKEYRTVNTGIVLEDLTISNIVYISGNTVEITFLNTPDLSGVSVRDYLYIYQGASIYNTGKWQITTVDNINKKVRVSIPDSSGLNTQAITGKATVFLYNILLDIYKTANTPNSFNTLLYYEKDALHLAKTLQSFYSTNLKIFSFSIINIGILLEVGDIITLKYPRYNLSQGKKAMITRIEEQLSQKITKVSCLVSYS